MTSAIILSFKVSLCCVIVLLPPGIALGWLLARKNFFGKSILLSITHVPMVIPPVATGYVLLLIFGNNAMLGRALNRLFGLQLAFTWYGAVLASAIVSLPLMVRTVRIAMEQVDFKLEQAARSMGASWLHTFFNVTLPLAFPGILAGAVLTFARSLGEFGATVTFAGNLKGQTQTLPLAAYTQMQIPGGDAAAAQLVAVSVIISIAAIVIAEMLTSQKLSLSRAP